MISQRSTIPDQADVSALLGMIEKLEMLFFKYSNQKKWTRRWCFLALQRHNTENMKQIFPEKELRGLCPNFHIHVF
jgi:hypothetical protein